MTEESFNEQDIFAQLNITKILVGILEIEKEISIPANILVNAGNEDKELQVDYNSDNQTFTFKLKDKDGQRNDNN